MNEQAARARLAVDIGGTFTDVVVERGEARVTAKVLTTPEAPERGVMAAVEAALAEAGIAPGEVALVLHGTTLATNALIERKGAVTALITTEGFRDSVEIAYENRFEQYDVNMEKPAPLVPRYLRFTVPERGDARGQVLLPLDEAAVAALVPELERHRVASVAIGLLHSYANPRHEERIAELLAPRLPEIAISLSSQVSPEMREYERLSTTCANAYVQPLMAGYLERLAEALRQAGCPGPLLLMTSGGGVTSLETAVRFPIRLVESGPAGGAILASRVAAECGLDQVLAFDMGGTTAKMCLIDDGQPESARTFEVARVYRFLKGSGLPLRIPVIEMVEIGAGGGSIAQVDVLKRITVGPESAGADPGPACYGLGGAEPTVTDADLALGRIDAQAFAGGAFALDVEAASGALERGVGEPLGLDGAYPAFGVSEMVDENMANAARVHAIERGKTVSTRTLIAFGGAAPLHAARLAGKLGIDEIVVPTGAGVGSAIGILGAPVSYEVVRSRYLRLSAFEPPLVNDILAAMRDEAYRIVEQGAPGEEVSESRTAFMRYTGQGHEIAVPIPARELGPDDAQGLSEAFDAGYKALFGRLIPGLDVEILSWALSLATRPAPPRVRGEAGQAYEPQSQVRRQLFDPGAEAFHEVPVFERHDLAPGATIAGPAVIAEAETSTVVAADFDAHIDAFGYIVMRRRQAGESKAP
jgi:N-methylhydantoinase A